MRELTAREKRAQIASIGAILKQAAKPVKHESMEQKGKLNMLTATKQWHCNCGCNGTIEPGDQFTIRAGTFFKEGHETPDALDNAGISPDRVIVHAKIEIPQRDLEELPLFNLEYQRTEQLSLFSA